MNGPKGRRSQVSGGLPLKTLAEINAQIVLVKTMIDRLDTPDPMIAAIGLALAVIQEELIEMDLYGTYTPNP